MLFLYKEADFRCLGTRTASMGLHALLKCLQKGDSNCRAHGPLQLLLKCPALQER